MERSFLTTEIDECCLGNSVDDKRNTIYGYFVAERSGSNDLRYHPAESRTLTPVNQTQPNHSPATASKNWANFLAVLLGGFLSTFMHHQLSLHLASQKILNSILRESKTIFPS